jgi:hypothetical protein
LLVGQLADVRPPWNVCSFQVLEHGFSVDTELDTELTDRVAGFVPGNECSNTLIIQPDLPLQ